MTASSSGMPTAWPGTSNAEHSASSHGSGFPPCKTSSFFSWSTHTVGESAVFVSGSIPMNRSGTAVSIHVMCGSLLTVAAGGWLVKGASAPTVLRGRAVAKICTLLEVRRIALLASAVTTKPRRGGCLPGCGQRCRGAPTWQLLPPSRFRRQSPPSRPVRGEPDEPPADVPGAVGQFRPAALVPAGRNAAKGDTRVRARGLPVSQSSRRARLIAAPVKWCCRPGPPHRPPAIPHRTLPGRFAFGISSPVSFPDAVICGPGPVLH